MTRSLVAALAALLAACEPEGDKSVDACDEMERCNGIDDDCDGTVDQGAVDAVSWYHDADEDGFGDDGVTQIVCDAPPDYTSIAGDCDDADAGAHPGAAEDPCADRADRDCDGLLEPEDADGDGWSACQDCDEADATVNPGAVDDCDGLDQDCDGATDEDANMATWYADGDGDGAGSTESIIEACSQPTGYAASWEDCDDTDSAIAPGLPEVCEDGIDQNCSGDDVECGIWADARLADSAMRVTGDGDSWAAGVSARFVGDVDGDGLADMVVGAYQSDLGTYLGGAAYLLTDVHEGEHLLSDAATASLAAIGYYDLLGFSVSPLGDPDSDGYADVLIGAINTDGATPDSGAAYVIYGPWVGSVSATEADATLGGETPNAGWAGYDMDNAGDIDGDGVEDVVISAPYAWNLGATDGEVYILFGPPEDIGLRSADVQIQPAAEDGMLGLHVAGLGDMDGDGAADVIVGWPQVNLVSEAGGAAVILSSPPTGTVVVPDVGVALYEDDTRGCCVGIDVSAAGDLNGDGYADALVGQRDPGDSAGMASGAVFVVYGPVGAHMSLASAESQLLGVESDEWAERGNGDGDLDADGWTDLVIGARGPRYDSERPGEVYVLYGPIATGTMSLSYADVTLTGESEEDSAGGAVSIDGDVNRDGYDDMIVGAKNVDTTDRGNGAVYLLYGGPP